MGGFGFSLSSYGHNSTKYSPTYSTSRNLRSRVYDDIDCTTKHWSAYPTSNFSRRSEPQKTYSSFISDTFQPVQRLWRSASFSGLRGERSMKYDRGSLRRTSSYSSLAPSQAMPFRERSVERYVSSSQSYAPKTNPWRQEHKDYRRDYSYARSLEKPLYSAPIYTPPSRPVMSYLPERTPMKVYGPTTQTRWQMSSTYNAGRWSGINTISPFLLNNYSRDDYTTRNRLYYNVRCASAPTALRSFNNSWYRYTPSRIITVR